MSTTVWTYIMVGITFSLYLGIAWVSRVRDTRGFYVAGGGVPPLANGMATAADWMSAASFMGMAGIISFAGYTGSIYLMGWTGGYVLLALLLAPYLRKFGKFTVPDFVGDRYYSGTARVVALLCAVFVSLTYVAGQMRGVGIVFSRFLEVDVNTGVIIGMAIVFFYAGIGGMKGITWTQVAQYSVLIVAFIIPAAAISKMITGTAIPQLGFGSAIAHGPHAGKYLLETLDAIGRDLGFAGYTEAFGAGGRSMQDVIAITMALMVGTAGLPHVIIRFYTVPTVRGARLSAVYALLFIAVLYTTAPAIAAFARYNLVNSLNNVAYTQAPSWFANWERTGLVAWLDKNNDGIIQYRSGNAFAGKPDFSALQGAHGQRLLHNAALDGENELYVDRDIIVLANPEIAGLAPWVIALVAAGALAAALSTASGLLLVIASSISHDLYYRMLDRQASEKKRLLVGRVMIGVAVCIAGYFGMNPPGFVAQVVALAFGLAASSFFPTLVLGIFWKRATREGAITGMVCGIGFTMFYIVQTKFMGVSPWFFGISPEGIGCIGMLVNFVLTAAVSLVTPPPPAEVQEMVESIRIPRGASAAIDH
ncbi:putative sodium symporter protein [Oleidesulfovibrio alaskensis G20]|jgi:cation/acetate symporter|uniref:Putative sodium symporter protein n=1 Tax=Oleidesulfovibrio alaskensis (strain ATCC BAA-1058 / DSM 17464 / G20) TaxID=207559 RepID=Q315G5_OLEA2|nr:sodium:solute symporter family protein [Oleidesulfovibrio alaskensis]ABB37431.1 putative sodium symporter protein [Oleidesulfovibrio alaskensis G20]MBG0774469.1 cation acetate symporter [Oleidesulfovibrio alaskensis]MBL3580822.1 cation acetate symporter [Oleidesulfovibrio alaskensis]